MKRDIEIPRTAIPVLLLIGMLFSGFFASSAWSADDNLKLVVLKVEDMTCISCPATIKAVLKKLPGVVKAEVSYKEEKAEVSYQNGKVTVEQMIKAIEDLGYRASLLEKESDKKAGGL